jgi:hypothetical protein
MVVLGQVAKIRENPCDTFQGPFVHDSWVKMEAVGNLETEEPRGGALATMLKGGDDSQLLV